MTGARKQVRGRAAIVGAIILASALVLAASAQAATPHWKMLAVTGPTYLPPKQSEIQKIRVEASGGDFTLSYAGETTASIAYDATAAVLQGALEALPAIGPGAVTVSGGPGGSTETPFLVEFVGPLAEMNVDELVGDDSGLAGEHAAVHVFTPLPGGPGTGQISIDPANVGGAPTSGTYTVELGPLPAGVITSGTAHGEEWTCGGGAGESSVKCTNPGSVPGLNPASNIIVPIEILPSADSSGSTTVSISGAGGGSDSVQLPIVVSKQQAPQGTAAFWAGFFDENGNLESQAGGHPYSAIAYFMQNTVRSPAGVIITIGDPKDVLVDLPPGFLGDPLSTPRCSQSVVSSNESPLCNKAMSVGRFDPSIGEFGQSAKTFVSGFYNDIPPYGYAAEFTTTIGFPLQSLLVSVRNSEDYGIRITGAQISHYARVFGAFTAIEGFPKGAPGKAFFRNPTSCYGEPLIPRTKSDSWQEQGIYSLTTEQVLPPVHGCEKLQFHPGFAFRPTATSGSSGSGAVIDLDVPQGNLTDPNTLATPDLKRAEIVLPPEVVLNPASADGLQGCSESQIGLIGANFPAPNPIRFNPDVPTCPDGSKLGTAEIDSPLVEDPLQGVLYLASPEENPFHALLGVYLVVNDARTGVVLKLPGEVLRDPVTGQLTARFDNNPQLPFEELRLNIRGGGPRSQLTTPEVCGHYRATGTLTPWSAPQSGPPAQIEEAGFDVSSGCASSPAARPFAPGFEAGTGGTRAGTHEPLIVKVTRNDGEQELTNLSFTLPKGLIGKLAGIPYCPDAAIVAAEGKTGRQEGANPSCPAASQVGTVDAGAGVGPAPFHVGGKIYLSGPYKGAPVSTVAVVPAIAGPFDLGNVVIRAPLYVDHESAVLSAKSDPIPTILKGFPLKVRSVTIKVDRPGFILNPTDCTPMTATASLRGGSGAIATPSSRFQVGGCDGLKFTPKLRLTLKGGKHRNDHPALTAVLTQPSGQANIARVSVALPRSEFLEQGHIRTNCTRIQFAAEQCPKGSIYGHAEAVTPLLDQPLKGPVYLRSSSHRLPDLVIALKGPPTQPIEIDLDGRIDSVHGGIRTTFETVPDAPVSKFVLRLPGGKKSLIVNSTDICRGTHRATAKMVGQNALRHTARPLVRARCGKEKGRKHGRHRRGRRGKK